jgi:streptogramin lyase
VVALRRFLVPLVCVALGAFAAPAFAAPAVTEVDVPTAAAQPRNIILGPDGNLWFAEEGTNKIGKVVPGSPPTVTDVLIPQAPKTITGPRWLTIGPDGNIWFSADVDGAGGVAKFSPADPATITGFGGFGITAGNAQGVATGFDNRIWLLDAAGNGRIVRINPADGTTVNLDIPFAGFNGGRGLRRGADGNMYAASFASKLIAQIPGTGGTPVEKATVGGAWDILSGPDGNIYFTMPDTGIGKTSPADIGTQTAFKPSTPVAGDLFGIAVGADGALWSPRAQDPGRDIARMTTSGEFSFIKGLQPNGATQPRPEYIAAGPDSTLWFTDKDANKIGRISGILPSGGGGSGGGGTTLDKTPPGVSGAGMSDTTVVVGPAATPLKGTAADTTGTTIRYTLTEAASVSLRIDRRLKGKRVKKGKKRVCAKRTRKNRKKKSCTLFKKAGTLTRTSHAGKNNVKFSGRIGKKALKVGKYRLTIIASDAAGNKSKPKSLNFRVVKPKKRKRR